MAVQGQPKERMCPQCFEINVAGATFCQLCGASLADGKEASEGSDTEVYRELAQTNLHRMRGNYKEAIQACLGILKKYPNNATAHTLLGDVHAEMGELQQAVEWYEMALDLNPSSEADKAKVMGIKKRIHDREQAQTAEQIGLAQSGRPNPALYIGGMAAVIILVAAGSFALGGAFKGGDKPAVTQAVGIKTDPKKADAGKDVKPVEDPDEKPVADAGTKTTPAAPVVSVTGPDKATVEFLRAQGRASAGVLNVSEDPRSSHIIVTAELDTATGAKNQAALIAADVFTVLTTPAKATLRIVQGTNPVFVADVDKTAWETAKAGLTDGQTASDVADTILTGKWPEGS